LRFKAVQSSKCRVKDEHFVAAAARKLHSLCGGWRRREKIPPTMFSLKTEIPDLHYCFSRDTVNSVKMVKTGISSFLPIFPSVVHDMAKMATPSLPLELL
jgi:hypothetical protein